MEQFDKNQLEKADQHLFTDSFNVCWELLKKKEYYLSDRETNICSKLSLDYGHDMYEAMVIFMKKIINSNKHRVAVKKSKVGSIKIVTIEATRDSGYDDNYDQSNQQQQKQVDKVNIDIDNSQDKMISKKKKISVDETKKIFGADNKKNNCDDSSYAKNIRIASSNKTLIEKLHMIDLIKKEEKLFSEQSITIKDEMLPVTDDSIDVDKINNSDNPSIRPKIKSNKISDLFKDDNKKCSNKVIDNVDHQKNTRIRTGSLAPRKYSVYTEKDDELSSTADENEVGNCLNLEGKIKMTNEISFEVKTRVVRLAREHPTWSLNMLRKHSGCKNINDRRQVEWWKKQIERGGTLRQKMNLVNDWVINKCIEKQKKGEIITNEKIKTLGLEAKEIFEPIKFSAAASWLTVFKKNYKITGKPNNLKINCNMQKKKSFFLSSTHVPNEIKVKVVNLANENPHWSLDILKEQSGFNIENFSQLRRWKKTVRGFNKQKASSFSTGSTAPKKFNSTSVKYKDENKNTSLSENRCKRGQI